MVREAPAAWSCFFILHIISNPDTQKKYHLQVSPRSSAHPWSLGGLSRGFISLIKVIHPVCWAGWPGWWVLVLVQAPPESRDQHPGAEHGQRGYVSLNDPQSGKHTNCQHSSSSSSPTSLHRCVCFSLRTVSSSWFTGCCWFCMCECPTPPRPVQLAAGIGSGEKRGNARN